MTVKGFFCHSTIVERVFKGKRIFRFTFTQAGGKVWAAVVGCVLLCTFNQTLKQSPPSSLL